MKISDVLSYSRHRRIELKVKSYGEEERELINRYLPKTLNNVFEAVVNDAMYTVGITDDMLEYLPVKQDISSNYDKEWEKSWDGYMVELSKNTDEHTKKNRLVVKHGQRQWTFSDINGKFQASLFLG